MLPDSLKKHSPRPVYLLTSEEPLLTRDWLDQARSVLQEMEFEDIQSHQVEVGFEWDRVLQDGQSMSLFSSRKAIIIRFNSARPGTVGARFINEICDQADADTVYILVMPKLEAASKNSAWLKKIRQLGEVCEIKPVYSNQLAGWITQRAAQKGITLDHQAGMYLADLTEGNLLATDQELEKLALSCEPGAVVNLERISDSISRSSRYNQFLLVDACLGGQAKRALKILQGLRLEGLSPVQMLYPLQQCLENLLELKSSQQQNRLGRDTWQSLRIWASKQKLYSSALSRLSRQQIERLLRSCAKLDRLNKGQQRAAFAGDDWLALQQLVNTFSGLQIDEYRLA